MKQNKAQKLLFILSILIASLLVISIKQGTQSVQHLLFLLLGELLFALLFYLVVQLFVSFVRCFFGWTFNALFLYLSSSLFYISDFQIVYYQWVLMRLPKTRSELNCDLLSTSWQGASWRAGEVVEPTCKWTNGGASSPEQLWRSSQ